MDAAEWDAQYSTKEYVWATAPNQFVETHLSDLAPGTAIDLGAGECRNAVWLASKGWSVTAVDFSATGLDKGRRLANDHDVTIEFVQADATTYSPDALVDLVVVSYLQLERPGRATVLEHAKTWLAPGGTTFLIAHDQTNVENGHGPLGRCLLQRRRDRRRLVGSRDHDRRSRRPSSRNARRPSNRPRHLGARDSTIGPEPSHRLRALGMS